MCFGSDLDHTADVQLHSWGLTVIESFEEQIYAMFDYISELSTVEIDEKLGEQIVEVEGHDLESLLYAFMDEYLFQFCTELFIPKEVKIVEFNRNLFKIKSIGKGEKFNREKNAIGTEIKAITYSNMQIIEKEDRVDVYVIVDI